MGNLILSGGRTTFGGGVVKLSSGTVVAVFCDSSGIVAYKDVDGTPSKLGTTQTTTTVHGSGTTILSISIALDDSDVVHVLSMCDSPSSSYLDVRYNTLSGIDSTPTWGTWETVATYDDDQTSTATGNACVIRIDSNGYPRVAWIEDFKYKGVGYSQPYYSHDVGSGWITKERVETSDTDEAQAGLGMEIASDDDVEVGWALWASPYGYKWRRRNSSWGSINTWSTNSPNYSFRNAMGRNGSDVFYRYAIGSAYMYENDASTGYAARDYKCASAAVLGTYRFLVFVPYGENGALDVAYNDGGGWEVAEDEQSGTSLVSVVAAAGYANNGFSDGKIGYIYTDYTGSFYTYYDEYDAGAAAVVWAEAHLTGAGDLDADPYKITSAAATLAGTGDLDATTLVQILASASPSGAGDLSAILERIVNDSATLTGEGDLSAIGEAIVAAVAHLTGAGDLDATYELYILASATLAGTGDLDATTYKIIAASATLSGTGDLTAIGGILRTAEAHLTGAGDLSATGERIVLLSATLSGTGGLAAVPTLWVLSDASLSGVGDLSAVSELIVIGDATLAGVGGLSADAYKIIYAAATLSGQGDLSATGEIGGIVTAEAHLTGEGDLSADAYKIIPGNEATLSGVGDLDATTLAIIYAAATLSGVGDLSAICEVVSGGIVTAEAHLTGEGDLSASPYLIKASSALLSGVGDLSAHGVLVFSGSAVLSGSGSMSATSTLIINGIARPIEGFGDLSATAMAIVLAAAELSGHGDIYVSPMLVKYAQATLSGVGDLSAFGYIEGWVPDRRVYKPRDAGRIYNARGDRTYRKEED